MAALVFLKLRLGPQGARVEGHGLPFSLTSNNDVIFGLRQYVYNCCGALLGIEVKRVVNYPANFRQAVTEWIVASHKSWFPYVQVYPAFVLEVEQI